MRLLFLLLLFASPLLASPKILVSIAPEKYLVDRITNNTLDVEILVPSGASPHSYEPSLRQMMDVFQCVLWFRIGENFENQVVEVLSPHMEIIDLREGVELLPLSCCHHSKDAHDSHTWLSPKLLKIQAVAIAEGLKQQFPEHSPLFIENLSSLLNELDLLDQDITKQLDSRKIDTILVSHPAFGYFCREYGLKQLSIEVEGKEPSPKQVTSLLKEARLHKIRQVYVQPQYSRKGADRVAHELKAQIVLLDPYEEDVVGNLRTLAKVISR